MNLDLTASIAKLLDSGIAVVAVVFLAALVVLAGYLLWRMQDRHTRQLRERDREFHAALAAQQAAASAQLQHVVESFRDQQREQAAKFSEDLSRIMDRLDRHSGEISQLTTIIAKRL
jgi:Flp pilus assembly protein TadB